jgi:hypothetical protein
MEEQRASLGSGGRTAVRSQRGCGRRHGGGRAERAREAEGRGRRGWTQSRDRTVQIHRCERTIQIYGRQNAREAGVISWPLGWDILAQGLIELTEYPYQQGASSFSEAYLERTSKLSVLGLEQFVMSDRPGSFLGCA